MVRTMVLITIRKVHECRDKPSARLTSDVANTMFIVKVRSGASDYLTYKASVNERSLIRQRLT